jgi:hypothetical protein
VPVRAAGAEAHALGHRGDPGEGEDRLAERQRAGELGARQDDVLADPDAGKSRGPGLEGGSSGADRPGSPMRAGQRRADITSCLAFYHRKRPDSRLVETDTKPSLSSAASRRRRP